MMTRESVHVSSYVHSTPIPAACRIGPMLWTSPISPYNRGSRTIPADLDAQFENLFTNIGDVLEAAGATWDQIGKMEFYVADVDDLAFKTRLGKYWLKYFPDENSRPARHTIHIAKLMPNRAVTVTFMAYMG